MGTDDEVSALKYRRMRDLNNEASKRCRENRKSKLGNAEAELRNLYEKNLQLRKLWLTMNQWLPVSSPSFFRGSRTQAKRLPSLVGDRCPEPVRDHQARDHWKYDVLQLSRGSRCPYFLVNLKITNGGWFLQHNLYLMNFKINW